MTLIDLTLGTSVNGDSQPLPFRFDAQVWNDGKPATVTDGDSVQLAATAYGVHDGTEWIVQPDLAPLPAGDYWHITITQDDTTITRDATVPKNPAASTGYGDLVDVPT